MIRLSTYIAHSASQGYALRFPSIGEGNYRPAYYTNGTNFVHGGKGFLQNYNADQKTAIRALPESADDNDYYLFFVDCYDRLDTAGMVSNEIVSGYMPVGRHYGFIYNEFNNTRTIAHELGHGVNALHHTFSKDSESFCTTQKTDNLMDYAGVNDKNFNHWQWQDIHQPKSVRFKWAQNEEGAETIIDDDIDEKYLKSYIEFITELRKFKLFNNIFKQLDSASKDVKVMVELPSDIKLSIKAKEITDKNDISISYNGSTDYQYSWWDIFHNGEKSPCIYIYPNYKYKKGYLNKNGNAKVFFQGNGLALSTLFEEFFHAAHYIFDKERNYTQTEVEVEIAQAFVFYVNDLNGKSVKKDSEFSLKMNKEMDTYEVCKNCVLDVFDKIINGQTISSSELKDMADYIYNKKSPIYQKMKKYPLDYNLKYITSLLNSTYIQSNDSHLITTEKNGSIFDLIVDYIKNKIGE